MYNINGTFNQITLLGRLGADPELKATPAGIAVCTLSLATTKGYKDSAGTVQQKTEWHKVICWREKAEYVAKYAVKGSRVFVVGSNETRSWQDKEGVKKYTTEVIADQQISVLTDKDKSVNNDNQPYQPAAAQPTQAAPAKPVQNNNQDAPEFPEPDPNDSDDLPF